MRVAILSLVLHTNYGGILQSYALQTALERMGHEVEVLSTSYKISMPPMYKMPFCYLKRLANKIIKDKNTPIFYEQKLKKEYSIISQNTQKFIDEYIHVRMIESFSEIKESDYDAIIVGSDQVWRPIYFEEQWKSSIDNAFLKFTKGWNVKRISYAASFGVDKSEYSEEQKKSCGDLLNRFDFVSVREDAGVKLCKDLFGVSAVKCCDPTMLLSIDDYKQLIPQSTISFNGKLLTYSLDKSESLQKIIDKVSKEKDLTPYEINIVNNGVKPSVESWIKGFSDAEFVITDSFHACVFSMIFNKPFLVVGNKSRGMSRFISLLKQFGQENRLISCVDDLSEEIINQKLGDIESVLNEIRNINCKFLTNA